MNTVLISVISFIAAVGIIVTVHEFGHFIVARWRGVRVLRFSIGFGKPLYSYQKTPEDTEYVLAAIPLGGYVKMLDEREGDVPQAQLSQAFNRKPVMDRIAIVFAGPLFNFIFAVFAYMLMYVTGVQGLRPEVGEVQAESLAEQAGLRAGHLIREVDGRAVQTWEEAALRLIDGGLKSGQVQVSAESEFGMRERIQLDLSDTERLLGEGNLLDKIGLKPWRYPLEAVLGDLQQGKPASEQGLRSGDRILMAGDIEIAGWKQWVETVQAHPEMPMDLLIEREGQRMAVQLTPASDVRDGESVGYIGAYPYVDEALIREHRVTVRYNPLESAWRGLEKTYEMSWLTLKLLGKLVMGEASIKNISGPISIAEYAGISAQLGLAAFLSTLAIISISIGILNLLPIPILDGGHLLYYLVELVKGSPVSEMTQAVGQRVGLMMLVSLMSLAFYNDIQRLLG